MLISTKGRYALRVLVDIAEHQGDGYLPLKEVAVRQAISEKYLEAIVKLLVKGNILVGLRGKGGGYRLNLPPEQLTAWQVLSLTEDSLATVACLEPCAPVCPRTEQCPTYPMWKELNDRIVSYLSQITIAGLMKQPEGGISPL